MSKPLLLLDENIGIQVVEQLRSQTYDAKSILVEQPGMRDKEVLELAVQEKRLLVTLDKDFGALIFRDSNKHVGVIFLRLKKESAENIYNILVNVLLNYKEKLVGSFVTVTESRIRIK